MKLDRAYFKEKHSGKKADTQYTECCNSDRDRNILNKNNDADRELMEEYCENSLSQYSSVESMKIKCCKKCGRLLNYVSILKKDRKHWT
jgi:tRNA U34 5-methylaminomethyl-2-thiouridine-forming methyltransferase MnmC